MSFSSSLTALQNAVTGVGTALGTGLSNLSSGLSTESTTRASADTTLNTEIGSETTRAEAEEATLQGEINTLQNQASAGGNGQCRLSVASATGLLVKPYNGNTLVVNGAAMQIPSAGVTITNAGLVASTLYYVYAYNNTGTLTLELSTTGHSTNPYGIEIKTGDTTRTLVGMIYTNSSAQFADTLNTRFCLNWFNRRLLAVGGSFNVDITFSWTSAASIGAATTCYFLSWGDEAVTGGAEGEFSMSAALGNGSVGLWAQIDSTSLSSVSYTSVGTNFGCVFTSRDTLGVSEGVHTAAIYGSASGTSCTVYSGAHSYSIRG